MEFNLPDECPFCGAEVAGGGNYTIYYTCGAHVWVEKHKGVDYWQLFGHSGDCEIAP